MYTVQPNYLCGTINFGRSAGGLVLIQRKYKTVFPNVSSLFIALDFGTNHRKEHKLLATQSSIIETFP